MILRFLRLFRAFREAELDRDEARASASRWEKSAEHNLESAAQHMRRGMDLEHRANERDAQCAATGLVLAETQAERDGIQRQLEAASGAKIESQDRVRDLEAHVTNLNGALAAAHEKESYSVKCVADWMAIQRFGVPIYGVAPPIPEGRNADAELIPRAGVQGRVLAQQMEDDFLSRMQ